MKEKREKRDTLFWREKRDTLFWCWNLDKIVCPVFLFAFLLNGCVILNLPVEAVKFTGTVVKTTGKVVEAVGSGVVTTVDVAGKCLTAGGKAAESAVQTPVAKELVIRRIIKP